MGVWLARLSRVPSERRKHGCQRERTLGLGVKREEMTRTLNREFKALLQPVGCRQEGRGRRIAHSSMICTYGVVNKTSAARAWPHGAFTTRTTSERAPGEHKRKPKASAPMSHESALGHFSCKIHKYLRTITRHSFTVSGFGTRVHMPTERRTV